MRRLVNAAFCVLALGASACSANYEKTAVKSWDLVASGQGDEALKLYEENVTRSEDSLLRLMDEGIILRSLARYEESNKKFFEAAKIIEMNGYLSLGEQATTLVTNERMKTYQGEDFEKVLVHLYLGLNFLSLGNEESALIESRKVNEILQAMINDGSRPYQLNAFARYLGAMLYENAGDYNDALVAYKNVFKIDEGLAKRFPMLGIDLIRMHLRLGLVEDLDFYQKTFGGEAVKQAKETLNQSMGAAVLLLESGKSPIKYSSKEYHKTQRKGGSLIEVMVPVSYYKTRSSRVVRARIELRKLTDAKGSAATASAKAASSAVLNDIEDTAITHLKDRMGREVAKALLTASVKAGIATGVGMATDSKELGLLTGIALFLISEADTRSWLLLPKDLQIAKIFLPPGTYEGEISYLTSVDTVAKTEALGRFEIKASKGTFIQRRAFE